MPGIPVRSVDDTVRRLAPCIRRLGAIAALASVAAAHAAADADGLLGPGHWRLVMSPGMVHANPSDEHEWVWAVGVERQRVDRWLFGASYFSNSFGQPSGYLYVGQRYEQLWQQPSLFFQWSAGLLYGYRGEYEGKVPFNMNGFSPGAVFSLGWQLDPRFSAQLNLLGDAGFMLQLSYDFR
jgi:hypothetical protein